MNNIYQPHKSKNLYRLSDAAEYQTCKQGCFEVRYNQYTLKSFDTFLNAFLYYLNLDAPVALWDVTEGERFIERKIFVKDKKDEGSC